MLVCRLQIVSDNYHRYLSKKKALDDLPEEPGKLSARDAFGVVMISHGEEFGDDSAFGASPHRPYLFIHCVRNSLGERFVGTSLVKFGQGMCKLATLQETQALTFKDTFSASLKMYHDEIKEYHVQRKKLESRRYGRMTMPYPLVSDLSHRLNHDAAISRVDRLKNSKKDKDKEEADVELDICKSK